LKHTVRNALIRGGGAVARIRGARPGKRAIVFHEVPDIARFRRFVDLLRDEHEIVGVDAWLNGPAGDRTQLLLTFDDGYASWHTAVAPLLAERQLPALFFVTSGVVGLGGEEGREFARERLLRTQRLEFINLDQLRDLAAQPAFEIGSHTQTHPDLGRINDRDAIREEVVGGQSRLEDWLGEPVRWFAYPFGTPANISSAARSVIETAGVEAAFTLIPGSWERDRGNRLEIGRDGLDPAMPFGVSRAWLRGGYDRLYGLKSGA
jgi:peptidoglycan/xylan/chitin deacetylase (PgdA/CDA1 family)